MFFVMFESEYNAFFDWDENDNNEIATAPKNLFSEFSNQKTRKRIQLGTKVLISSPSLLKSSSLDDDDNDNDNEGDCNSSYFLNEKTECVKTNPSLTNKENCTTMSDSMIFEKASETYLKQFSRQVSKLKQLSDKVVVSRKDDEQMQYERLKFLLTLLNCHQQQNSFGKRRGKAPKDERIRDNVNVKLNEFLCSTAAQR